MKFICIKKMYDIPFKHCFGYRIYDTDLVTKDHTVIRNCNKKYMQQIHLKTYNLSSTFYTVDKLFSHIIVVYLMIH